MSTLILRLAGPLQSWGTGGSRFMYRDSGLLPTKSGVIGLIANALGRDRSDDISDLAAARFAVRTERAGTPLVDYHTADTSAKARRPELIREVDQDGQVVARARSFRPEPGTGATQLTYRTYLHDAHFTAFVEMEDELAEQAAKAMRAPARQMFLGRRSCPPEGHILEGVSEKGLDETFETWERPSDSEGGTWSCEAENGELVDDQPVSFRHEHRRHTTRSVRFGWFSQADEHDPFRLMEA